MNILEDYSNAFFGGLIVSGGICLHLLLKGRLTNLSQIINSCSTLDKDLYWRIPIFCGMVITSCIAFNSESSSLMRIDPTELGFETPNQFIAGIELHTFGLSGFLIGVGSALTGGCTSYNGIIGIALLKKSAIVSFLIYLISGIVAAYGFNVSNHYFYVQQYDVGSYLNQQQGSLYILLFAIVLFVANLLYYKATYKEQARMSDIFIAFLVGVLYSAGLIYSQMVKPHSVLNFFSFRIFQSPVVPFFISSIVATTLLFRIILMKAKPIFNDSFNTDFQQQQNIDAKLIFGSVLFGFGWGLTGITPGTCFTLLTTVIPQLIIVFFPMMILGSGLINIYDYLHIFSLKELV